MKRGQIGTALVYGYCLGRAVLNRGLLKEAPRSSLVPLGSEQKIDGGALLVHRPVEISPPAFALDIRLIHASTPACRAFVTARRLLEQRHQLDDPAMHRRMIDADGALSYHLLKITKTQRIGHIPSHAQQHHVQK